MLVFFLLFWAARVDSAGFLVHIFVFSKVFDIAIAVHIRLRRVPGLVYVFLTGLFITDGIFDFIDPGFDIFCIGLAASPGASD